MSSAENNFEVFASVKRVHSRKWNPVIKVGNVAVTLHTLTGLDKIVGNNLVIANSESCLFQHQLFHYKSKYPSERKSNLHVEIKPEKDQTKMGIYIYSMVKLRILNYKLIKILQIKS